MKSILFVAIMALAIAACDTPQTTTGAGTDTPANRSGTDTATNRPDSTRQ
jgi:predicted small secreted protein